MADIVLTGDTSGSITIAAPSVAGTNTLTLPASTGNIVTTGDSSTITQGMIASGVAGTGPAFFVRNSSDQLVTTAQTKVVLDTVLFDTNSNFDNTTNYRFTPTVAGYYQINTVLRVEGTSTSGVVIDLFKNGTNYYRLAFDRGTTSSSRVVAGSTIVYFNGSTDYLEMYGQVVTGSSLQYAYASDTSGCSMSGVLVRADS